MRAVGPRLIALVAAAGSALAAPAAPPAAAEAAPPPAERHAVIVSVDGLMPAYYLEADALGVEVPNVRRLMAEGAWARGVVGVLPSVTYPSHTTLITGVPPRVHGIGREFPYPPTETERVDAALHILRVHRPHLLLIHVFDLDHEQHGHGPRSPEALAALEGLDVWGAAGAAAASDRP